MFLFKGQIKHESIYAILFFLLISSKFQKYTSTHPLNYVLKEKDHGLIKQGQSDYNKTEYWPVSILYWKLVSYLNHNQARLA